MESVKIENAFANLKSNAIIGLSMITDVKLTGGKKNPLQGHVTKLVEYANCQVFCNGKSNGYENKVNRNLEKEGKSAEDFVLGPRPWGSRIAGTPFVEHKGEKYLEVIFNSKPSRVTYMIDGKIADKSCIDGIPVKKEGHQGGLEDKVILRTPKFDNILSIRYAGKEIR